MRNQYTPAALFAEYKTTFDLLVSEFPAITFIYATTAITMGEEADGAAYNANRQTYNNLVRAEYESSGRLWDMADYESTDPSGNKILFAGSESLYDFYASPDRRHIIGPGRMATSSPLIKMIASL